MHRKTALPNTENNLKPTHFKVSRKPKAQYPIHLLRNNRTPKAQPLT